MIPVPELIPQLLAERLLDPRGLAFDANGTLWISEAGESGFVCVKPGESIKRTKIAGFPQGIAIDCYGRLFFADADGNAIKRFDPETDKHTLIADRVDGEPIIQPQELIFDSKGHLIFTCLNGNIGCVRPDGVTELIANELDQPRGLAMLGDDLLMIVESGKRQIWIGDWNSTERIWIDESVWSKHLGKIALPKTVARGIDGRAYACLDDDHQIAALNHDGLIIETINTGLLKPTCGAFDPTGTLGFVFCDAATGNIYNIPGLGTGIPLFDGGSAWPL